MSILGCFDGLISILSIDHILLLLCMPDNLLLYILAVGTFVLSITGIYSSYLGIV